MVGGPADHWATLGLALQPDLTATVGSVRLRIEPSSSPGLHTVGLLETDVDDLDGAPVHAAPAVEPASSSDHALGAERFDHVVLMTPDLDRTCGLVTRATGAPRRRVREAGAVRQGFFRLGEVILEVVQPPQPGTGRALWWGLVIVVTDLDGACARLGADVVGPPRAAVQPGRTIATVRAEAGFGLPLALMSTAPGPG